MYNVKLEIFEGPLDLLLYLIKKEEVDICDIPIAHILEQYMEYIRLMEILDLDIAGDFLVMASTLMYIKSRMLLPAAPIEEEEEDPRQELVDQLLEYKKFKEAADLLDTMEIKQKDVFERVVDKKSLPEPDEQETFQVSLFDLMNAFSTVLKKVSDKELFQEIITEEIKLEDKIADIIEILKEIDNISFNNLFSMSKSRIELIVTFLAVLELIRINEIAPYQKEEFGAIFFKKIA